MTRVPGVGDRMHITDETPTAPSAVREDQPQPGLGLPADRMLEAEVALRLADFILGQPGSGAMASVAIDGASIRMGNAVVFDIRFFMASAGWEPIKPPQVDRTVWSGAYRRNDKIIRMHSRPGEGDVIAQINGRRIIAKCQKGPLTHKIGSSEVPLLTTALGQALLFDVSANDIVVVAVPDTLVFRRLADAWRKRRLVNKLGFRIALVARDGAVTGL